jgi:LacI family transcriptional regulator
VFLGRDPGIEADVVVIDSFGPSVEVARALVGLGHRRVALLRPLLDTLQQHERGRGFRTGLSQAGLALDPRLDVRAVATVADGLAATTRLLSHPAAPTALFATNNALAIGAVAAVRALALRCPEDVSIVGYDSYLWQEHFEPRLTTVVQPAHELGQRAAQLLIGRVTGTRAGRPERVELAARLLMRSSCAAPARSRAQSSRQK